MSASLILLRLHLLVVLAFLAFFAFKAALLLLNRHEQLRTVRARSRVADSVLGLLILFSGGLLLAYYPGTTPGWLWLKLGLVLVLLPLAIAAMRRQNKPGVVLTLLGFFYVYGLAETGSLSLQRPAAPASYAVTPGLAESTATPDPEAPARLVDDSTSANTIAAVAAAADAAENADAPDAALTAGKAIFTQRCTPCHGADGRLGLNGARDLTKSNLNAAGRVYMVTNGSLSKKMPSFQQQLTEAQIQQVVAYSLTLR
ncbi:Invasion gene expression up-regulator, SirB [Hymenobacter gelipurpurascens]|uniref:Invasion gene expression up-regulator, SirB n=1 Tax=Hymenobacter gelipurpurascens TaxID=89968 RepID=A0A212UCX5_9BACT|nr:cytochrome c [Hymenobacter gelipurpurascens]SNC76033.1 Invasion gene expression up-regulator, SirB [Hymenobacter gelipurpurascens]